MSKTLTSTSRYEAIKHAITDLIMYHITTTIQLPILLELEKRFTAYLIGFVFKQTNKQLLSMLLTMPRKFLATHTFIL